MPHIPTLPPQTRNPQPIELTDEELIISERADQITEELTRDAHYQTLDQRNQYLWPRMIRRMAALELRVEAAEASVKAVGGKPMKRVRKSGNGSKG